ncbi:MAG: hypothetical protein A3C43_04365 [Candidatus Schekmanbacteria bacterium RIFCSPHIGHO2_02_FULL_38_11]|uniref:HTH arsR-type domain-containing protein n=1 Tax=Candidatus Schekmanbacteria bacterium RIFCSPLOWO2_12_FULL_38_15 TaxID=1817883 RepID=A0A1F7SNS6_9BACT|nr:MAG: hypothetical protein A2043_01315 [Candidatus Schekmanbacteria bacterium GWA2_38_9]OGL48787.1 MAG: hypothetical protein A3C43_04365 [Candidatus Schekmanbacteria bacterium RIFCSPHIGHO2_02_FULL_38_11]OGL51024.1 MAG: hypothetical protein A3H37_11145 [Candidatus Schekmanbacteria bacterium RIFCSPLOWO2_02_FULL_38_14]OGL54847.1 MAG: hypothetical protein A3G31_01865 [Candidatus Schekmanbacteria bacterium RIFCSPLOWO2_12_FULL_38_15]
MKKIIEIFKALSEENRLRIFNLVLLSNQEIFAGEISNALKKPQYTISRHIGILIKSGLIKQRRDGARIFYSLSEKTKELRINLLQFLDMIGGDFQNIFKEDFEGLREQIEKRKDGKVLNSNGDKLE